MKKTKFIALLMTPTMLFSVLSLPARAGEEEEPMPPLREEIPGEPGEDETPLLWEELPEPEGAETPEPGEEAQPEGEEPRPEREEPQPEGEELPAPAEEPAAEEGEPAPEEPGEPLTDEGWYDFIDSLPEPEGRSWNEDLLTLAESLIGQGVIDELTLESEDGEPRFYTRFGSWMGLPYEPWCASFVSFCIHHAGIPAEALPLQASCLYWRLALQEKGLYIDTQTETGAAFVPEPGDLVFFGTDLEKVPCHVGIVKEYKTAEYDEQGAMLHNDRLLTIEGNNGPAVAEFERERDARGEYSWLGYVSLRAVRDLWEQEREEEVRAHTAEVEENLLVCPMLTDENAVLWLVAVYVDPVDFRQYTWDGEPMLRSAAHNAWVSCVWSFEMPSAGRLAEIPGKGDVLEPSADLNGTGQEDLNDVQFLYSVYRESGIAMEQGREFCLRCDLNGNGVIDMADVQNLLFRISK